MSLSSALSLGIGVLVGRRLVPSRESFGQALVQAPEAEEAPPELRSSCHFSRLRRRAFMKKLLTVVSSRPSCWEMVICISLDGRLFSLKMAKSVRRWRSVNTRRDFFWELFLSLLGSCSLRLHAGRGREGAESQGEAETRPLPRADGLRTQTALQSGCRPSNLTANCLAVSTSLPSPSLGDGRHPLVGGRREEERKELFYTLGSLNQMPVAFSFTPDRPPPPP